ncbi:hypothetical protein Ancab_017345, partial [Ancistrocladus abbreviatus]
MARQESSNIKFLVCLNDMNGCVISLGISRGLNVLVPGATTLVMSKTTMVPDAIAIGTQGN